MNNILFDYDLLSQRSSENLKERIDYGNDTNRVIKGFGGDHVPPTKPKYPYNILTTEIYD